MATADTSAGTPAPQPSEAVAVPRASAEPSAGVEPPESSATPVPPVTPVTGSTPGFRSESNTSAVTAPVLKTLSAGTPTVSGSAVVGSTLSVAPGSWTSGTAFAYQWLANGVVIAKATAASYKAVAADAGKRLSVRVTGSKAGFTTVVKTSAVTAPVLKRLTAGTPTVRGTTHVGQTLTVSPGSWTAGSALAYQWFANGAAITGATKTSLVLAAAHRGRTITVRVTGTLAGYVTAAKTSAPTAKIAAVPGQTAPLTTGECPSWAPIKGNASSMIYHLPGGRSYAVTKAEACFSTEAAAVAAGFRAAKR
ncbi:sunset domain-containing protein [Microbacterium sp. RD1]|uniref:sunset domain-containing protein n=1 Tax=Microbacterium sp. RD1 TaxID=3457313 RepID=UPI003FA53A89